MKSPIKVREAPYGGYVAVTIRLNVGPTVHDTEQLCVGATGSIGDHALVAALRERLADYIAECIRLDRWPSKGVASGPAE